MTERLISIVVASLLLTTAAARAATFSSGSIFLDQFPVDSASPDPARWDEYDPSAANFVYVEDDLLHFKRNQFLDAHVRSKPLNYGSATEWVAEARVRVLDDGVSVHDTMLMIGADGPVSEYAMFFKQPADIHKFNAVFALNESPFTTWVIPNLDRGVFYTIGVHHKAAGGAGFADDLLDILLDGEVALSNIPVIGSGRANIVAIGDSAGNDTLAAEYDYFAVGGVSAVQIPEPSTAAFVIAGALTLLLLPRRALCY